MYIYSIKIHIIERCDTGDARTKTQAVSEGDGGTLSVRRHSLQYHSYAPNREEVEPLRLLTSMKRRTFEHPEIPPVKIMRTLCKIPHRLYWLSSQTAKISEHLYRVYV